METISGPQARDSLVILVNGSEAKKATEVGEEEKSKPAHLQEEYLNNTLMKKWRFLMLIFVSVIYASIYFNMDTITVL
jgi:hypothetical protein